MASSPFGTIKRELASAVDEALAKGGYAGAKSDSTFNFSGGFGDISSSVCFRLAKDMHKSPMDVAMDVARRIALPAYVKQVTTENGYLNFHLDAKQYSGLVIRHALGVVVGSPISEIGGKEKVIIEYPSVNPNKPWHLGHLKNAVLGDAVANIFAACSYTVEREDFIEDLGSQVVQSVWGYLNLSRDPGGKKFDQWLGEEYVKVNKHGEVNDIKGELSRLLQKMETRGTEEARLAREISERCVRAQNETAFAYGIYRDVLIWETDIIGAELFRKALRILESKGVTRKEIDGAYPDCYIMNLGEIRNLPPEFAGLKEKIKVLVRNDGTPTYVAKDIAFHMWKFGMLENPFRFEKFVDAQPNGRPLYTTTPSATGEVLGFGNVKKAINIIDVRQDYPQGLLKLAFRLLGRGDIERGIVHLSYGELELESGASLAGRKGNWIGNTADDLLAETKKKALEILSGSRFKLDTGEIDAAAQDIAVAAIKFDLLRLSPEKKTIFSWKRALNFETNSGPYCQYMYARARRMIEDSHTKVDGEDVDFGALGSKAEFNLVKLVSKAEDEVEKACRELRPSVLAEYANDLASAFSTFYEQSPVLKAPTERERLARLALTAAFAGVLSYILSLLGIRVLDRM